MTNFNFENMFNSPRPITEPVKPLDLNFLTKESEPSLDMKKKVIEDFILWAYKKELCLNANGIHLMYLDYLKKEGN